MVWRIKKLLSAALSFITGHHSGLFRIFNLADDLLDEPKRFMTLPGDQTSDLSLVIRMYKPLHCGE